MTKLKIRNNESITNNDLIFVINSLDQADKKQFSYQCPYLALADVLGYNTSFNVKNFPSLFGRLSVRKMLQSNGINIKLADQIYVMLEYGYSLHEISMDMRARYGY